MKTQNLPDIPILDLEIHSPYRASFVKSCTRLNTGKYLLITSLLDSVYVDRHYAKGERILYKIKKSIIDGQCKTTIEK